MLYFQIVGEIFIVQKEMNSKENAELFLHQLSILLFNKVLVFIWQNFIQEFFFMLSLIVLILTLYRIYKMNWSNSHHFISGIVP